MTYFHQTFALPVGSDFSGGLTMQLRVDDAAHVQVNGVTVYNKNIEASGINSAVVNSIASAGKSLVTVQVPASALRHGTNTVTASVHTNWSTGTYYAGMSWDASLKVNPGK